MTTLEIQLNKVRLAALLLIFIICLGGIALYSYNLFLDGRFSVKLILVLVIGIPVLLFLLWFVIKKIMSNKPALVLDSRGILDNINLSETGLIAWNSINTASMVKHQNSYFILLHLKNPERVVSRLTGYRLRLAKNNIKIFGTPVAINVDNLKIEKIKLLNILNAEIKAWN